MTNTTKHTKGRRFLSQLDELGLYKEYPDGHLYATDNLVKTANFIRAVEAAGYTFESSDTTVTGAYTLKYRSPGANWPMSVTLTYRPRTPHTRFILVMVVWGMALCYDRPYDEVDDLLSMEAFEMSEAFAADFPKLHGYWVPVIDGTSLV